jgi:mannosyl-oligosaccharide alpha-1,2-mannosidase
MGRKLTDGCIWVYRNSPRGVMPEIAHLVPCPLDGSCEWDRERWIAAILEQNNEEAVMKGVEKVIDEDKLSEGFTKMDDRRYILRPEAIESVFILYRITGDETYREAAWEMFKAIQAITTTQYGNAAIHDITAADANGLPPKQDRMESFWMAETLKYLYLIYSEPSLLSLDEYVLNTEAHPLKLPS